MIPLACIVDYYGIYFEVQTPSPLTLNTLVYGSDSEGLLFKNDDAESEQLAKDIAETFNLQPYTIKEKATGILKLTYLPYEVQIHRSDLRDEYYIVNSHRLIPNNEPIIQKQGPKDTNQDLLEFLGQLDSLGK